MTDTEKRIVEINGVKLEVDMRHAKTIDTYRVGDNIKVLVKRYGDEFAAYPGVIVGFDPFVKLPSITVCYLAADYSGAELKTVAINANSKDIEICSNNDGTMHFERSRVVDMLQRELNAKEEELKKVQQKIAYFNERFGSMFSDAKAAS